MNSFNDILQRMVESVEGATGAVFVDFEGEAVGEFARDLPQLEIRIVGAQWGVVWAELQRSFARARLGPAYELIVNGEHASVIVRQVTAEYYVVLAVGKSAHLAMAMVEIERGVQALRAEM